MKNQATALLVKLGAGVAVAAGSIGTAHAELPAVVVTKMEEAGTDGAALAVLGLLVVIAIAAVKYLRSAK